MTDPVFYRIVSCNPYLDTEEEWNGLDAEQAAARGDDLTSAGADAILADLAEVDPWQWTDEETGREVIIRREVS